MDAAGLKYIGAVEVGPTANWMTPTPDSKFMYVAISGSDHTAVVDLQKLAIVNRIKTGARPARISTAILPRDRVNAAPAQGPLAVGNSVVRARTRVVWHTLWAAGADAADRRLVLRLAFG